MKHELEWTYTHFGDELYKDLKKFKGKIEKHFYLGETKLSSIVKQKLLSQEHWNKQLKLLLAAKKLSSEIGRKQYDNFNEFSKLVFKSIKKLKLDLDSREVKIILDAISWR